LRAGREVRRAGDVAVKLMPLALIVVVGCAAGATATAGLLQVKNIVTALDLTPPITSKQLAAPSPGQPQTLLLIGVDHRSGEGTSAGLTDTMLLLRIDDSSTTINALSIPRDLAVNVAGAGVTKLNSAYSDGGTSLLIKTLRAQVFPKLRVNHVLVVDFASFANLINEIGCVYADVDRRYYNQSVGPEDPTTNYSSIDIQPGYQKLCGGSGSNLGGPDTALAFVRFRHNDSDFVREARQQAFLRWAKESLPSGQTLLGREGKLADYFGQDVQTDNRLHTTDGVDELFGLAFNADGHALKSITFPYIGTETINGGDDVTFSEAASAKAYQEFITPTLKRAPSATTPATTTTGPVQHKKKQKKPYTAPAGMTADTADGISQTASVGAAGLPVYYPKDIPDDFVYCSSISRNCDIGYEPSTAYASSFPRHYAIDGTGATRYPSYVMTLVASSGGYSDTATGEFATVQGTTWQNPPILKGPSAVKRVNGKLLDEYSQGGQLTDVAWRTKRGVYWIANTLQDNISNAEMVAMAATLTRGRA
jgi:LCP family protein required for cell wall assembly